MRANVLKGKPVSDAMGEAISADVAGLAQKNISPRLAIVRLGERPDDLAYERGIVKRCEALGVDVTICAFGADVSQARLIDGLRGLGADAGIHGILPFRPMPPQIDPGAVKAAIAPEKDIDCVGPQGSASVFDRALPGFLPCTAEAAVEMLKYYRVPLAGARAVILGRSMVVGRALALFLLDEHCTVTICHSRTREIENIAAEADILICAMGRAKKVGARYVKPGATVIDVGINDDGEGGICGDADFDALAERAGAITPVPGGIGVVTNTILVRNVVAACGRTAAAGYAAAREGRIPAR